MTTFIKAKFKKSDDPYPDKYRLAANITEYHIIGIMPLALLKELPYHLIA